MSKRKPNPRKGVDRELFFKPNTKRLEHVKAGNRQGIIPPKYLTPQLRNKVDEEDMIRILCLSTTPTTNQKRYWRERFRTEEHRYGKREKVIDGKTVLEFDPYFYLLSIGENPEEVTEQYYKVLVENGEYDEFS